MNAKVAVYFRNGGNFHRNTHFFALRIGYQVIYTEIEAEYAGIVQQASINNYVSQILLISIFFRNF